MTSCSFCKLVAGETPAVRVAEGERAVAFLDARPVTRGHMLVVAREHSHLLDVPAEDLAAVARLAKTLAERLQERLGADGVNLISSNELDVSHFHVNVIPRYLGTPVHVPWESRPGDMDVIKAAAAELTG